MTTTYPQFLINTVVGDPGFHSFAEVVVIICLVAVLVAHEMVRGGYGIRSRLVVPSLNALAIPLLIAWLVVTIERFVELVGG